MCFVLQRVFIPSDHVRFPQHHSYRSFQGFVCLMQISTRNGDYLIDTLELRNELHILNEWFTDPKILKVGHCGLNSDQQNLRSISKLSRRLINLGSVISCQYASEYEAVSPTKRSIFRAGRKDLVCFRANSLMQFAGSDIEKNNFANPGLS